MKRVLPYLLLLIALPAWAQFKTPGQRARSNLGPAVAAATNAAASATTTANTAAALAKGKALPPLPAMSPPSVNASVARVGGDLDYSRPSRAIATHIFIPNTAPGTVLNEWVILNGAPSAATVATTSTVGGVEGLCGGSCGATGSSLVQNGGLASCVFDGGTTAGDYVGLSTTSGGQCHDLGAVFPVGILVLGRVYSTNGGAGTYTINMLPPDVVGANGGGVNPPAFAGNSTYYASTASVISPINGSVHCGAGTLDACKASCPTNGPCHMIGDPGVTYTMAHPFVVGDYFAGGRVPQVLDLDNARVNCTDPTAGSIDNCIVVLKQSNVQCEGSGVGGLHINATNAAHLDAVIATIGEIQLPAWSTGAHLLGQMIFDGGSPGKTAMVVTAGTSSGAQPTFAASVGSTVTDSGGVVWKTIFLGRIGSDAGQVQNITGCNISGNTAAPINSVVHIGGTQGGKQVFANSTYGGISANGTGLLIDGGSGTTGNGSGASLGCCVRVYDTFLGPGVASGGGAAYGVRVTGGVSLVDIIGGQIGDISGANNIALVSVDGGSQTVHFGGGLYFEFGASGVGEAGTDGILISNSTGVTFNDFLIQRNGSSNTFNNCFHITNNAAQVFIEGTQHGSSPCATNQIKNDITGYALAAQGGSSMNYYFPGGESGTGFLIDGPLFGGASSPLNAIQTQTISGNTTYVLPTFALTTQTFTFSASGTVTLPQASYPGQILNGIVCQNGTGGFTPAFAAGAGLTIVGTFPVFTTATSKCGDFSLTYDTTTHAYLTGGAAGPL